VDLTALSETYGDFYAPAFAIRAGADDLLRDALIGITMMLLAAKLVAEN